MADKKIFTPSFTRGTLANIQAMIATNKVVPPIFGFATDKECMVYYDIDKKFYAIQMDKIAEIEEKLEGLVDPETGESISVPEYVEDKIEPIQEDVTDLQEKVGSVYMLIGGDD